MELICEKCGSHHVIPTGYGYQIICQDCGQIWRIDTEGWD